MGRQPTADSSGRSRLCANSGRAALLCRRYTLLTLCPIYAFTRSERHFLMPNKLLSLHLTRRHTRIGTSFNLFVFLLCFDQNWNVWVGIFPQREEVFVCLAGLWSIVLEDSSTC